MSKLYTEEQVRRLLDMQKGNCYVAILTHTRDEKIASLAISAPLPGGDQFNEHFSGVELPTNEEMEERAERNISPFSFIDGAKWMRDKIQGGRE